MFMREKIVVALVALAILATLITLVVMVIETPVVGVILAGMSMITGLIFVGARYAR